MTFLLQSIIIF